MNFLPFKPSLVGGHCIGVDPYCLTHKAQEIGYNPEIILAGRRLNDSVGVFVANQVIKLMIKNGQKIEGAKVLMLGITFKENCPDIRNSKVIDVINELQDFGAKVEVYDPWVDAGEVREEYGCDTLAKDKLPDFVGYGAIVLAVAHDQFMSLSIRQNEQQVIYDVKGFLKDADARL